MTIGMGDIAAGLLLAGICALAWRRRRDVGGKTWAFRVVPIGAWFLLVLSDSTRTFCFDSLLTLFAYGFVAYYGGWRLEVPKQRWLNGIWWSVHILVYFLMAFIVCVLTAGVVRTVVRYSPFAIESDWPWTEGRITEELPFAVEYQRKKTFCAEYDKRILFKSGKRIGLPMDTCGFGPYRVYRLKDGNYCLVDGYCRNYSQSSGERYLRVDASKETVELKFGIGWFKIPEKGYVRGWGGEPNGLSFFVFDMYSGGDLNNDKGWSVKVDGTPLGDSPEGMKLIGEIDTDGKFRKIVTEE